VAGTRSPGFLVQRNHESGGIVIVYRLPERCDSGNSVISTFCNRDIFVVQRISPPQERSTKREGKFITENGQRFRPQRVAPTGECRGSRTNNVHGGVRGMCSSLSPSNLTADTVPASMQRKRCTAIAWNIQRARQPLAAEPSCSPAIKSN
jgi:hypothetical protein